MSLFGCNPFSYHFCHWIVGSSVARMSFHKVSMDIKAQIPALFQQGFNINKVCGILDIKKTLVYQVLSGLQPNINK